MKKSLNAVAREMPPGLCAVPLHLTSARALSPSFWLLRQRLQSPIQSSPLPPALAEQATNSRGTGAGVCESGFGCRHGVTTRASGKRPVLCVPRSDPAVHTRVPHSLARSPSAAAFVAAAFVTLHQEQDTPFGARL
jgi:hypothetical protein